MVFAQIILDLYTYTFYMFNANIHMKYIQVFFISLHVHRLRKFSIITIITENKTDE